MLALDIGGTTAKCSLIENGNVTLTSDYWIERSRLSAGYPVMVPVVDLVEIGNGGGSIAWVDEVGAAAGRTRSAGAIPGPAAYGRGGAHATTTDANLALGRITGLFPWRRGARGHAAVNTALDALAGPLGLTRQGVARGIVRIANNNMINALKLVSINRGYDPRDFAMVVFGGGGGMHGAALAAELGIRRVVVPATAAVFSAWGMLMSDLRRDYIVTRLCDLTPDNMPQIGALIRETQDEARVRYAGEGIAPEQMRFRCWGGCATRTRNTRSKCRSRTAWSARRWSPISTTSMSGITPTGWMLRWSSWPYTSSHPPKSASWFRTSSR